MDDRGVGRGLRGLRLARPDPALPARVRPSRPSRPRPGGGDARRGAGPRRLPPARPRAGDARRADRSSRHGARHVRPRPPALHPGDQHEPRPRAPRLPAPGPRIGAGRPARLGPRAVGRPGRLRPAGPARQGGGAHGADRLGADAGLHERRLDRRGRVARAARPRARGHGRAGATTSGCGPSSPPRSTGFADPATGEQPIRRAVPREQVLEGRIPRPRPRPAARGRAALLAHPCPADRGAGRLALGRPPARGRLRRRRAGRGAGGRIRDLAHRLRRRSSPRRSASSPTPAWSAAHREPDRWRCSRTQEQREVEERLRGLGYLE